MTPRYATPTPSVREAMRYERHGSKTVAIKQIGDGAIRVRLRLRDTGAGAQAGYTEQGKS